MDFGLPLTIDLPDESATAALAGRLARRAQIRDVIALKGELGSGKTSFARAFIRARGSGGEEVPSPTFTLVEIYEFSAGPPVWHFDLFRLSRAEEAYELGVEEAVAQGISLIEWPERLAELLPRGHLEVALLPGGAENARIARLSGAPPWPARLDGIADG